MSENYYEIQEQTKYYIVLSGAIELEEVVDVAFTWEEIKEQFGDVTRSWYSGHRFFTTKIKGALTRYARKIPADKKSIKIDDEELIDALKKAYEQGYALSDFIKGGYRRVGDRLYKHSKAAKSKAIKKDGYRLLNAARRLISLRSGMYFTFSGGAENVRTTTLTWVTETFTWEELKATMEEAFDLSAEDAKWSKAVYDKPDMFGDYEDKE